MRLKVKHRYNREEQHEEKEENVTSLIFLSHTGGNFELGSCNNWLFCVSSDKKLIQLDFSHLIC